MNCDDSKQLLDSYVDGELDLVNHLQVEQHLEECADCSQAHKNLVALRAAMADDSFYYQAPADLRARLRTSLKTSEPESRSTSIWKWKWIPVFAAASLLVAILLTTFTFFRTSQTNEDLVAKEVVSAHIRSMMPGHLMDVPSSDQHTVKPWFDGKLDFAPPVTDLAAQGFPLTGGRLDYVDGRPVAALVYGRRLHVINLFIFPTGESDTQNRVIDRQGYNVIHWNKAGMSFWAVSDVNVGDLQTFATALQN